MDHIVRNLIGTDDDYEEASLKKLKSMRQRKFPKCERCNRELKDEREQRFGMCRRCYNK